MNGNSRLKKNFIVSLSSQIIIFALGFIIPRIVLINYGSDVNGFISTVSQIFAYLALLESGIGQAAKNVLYKPVTEHDKNGISYYMSVARNYYRRLSYIYFAAVVVFALFIPVVIKTDVNYFTVFFYTLFDGLINVVSFYYINTWVCLLNTDGHTYVNQTISLGNTLLCYTVKIVLSLLSVNIVFIEMGYFGASLVRLLVYAKYMKKHYGWINYSAAEKNIKLPDRNAYVITEIAWTIFSSTDMIVLSMFVSASMSSVYAIYNMVYVALIGFLNAIYHSLSYKLGQSYIEGIDKYAKIHDIYNSCFMACITVLMCVTYLLMLPFVKLYTVGVTDINYIYKWLPLMFCLVQILSWSRFVAGNISGLAGYAKQTSYVSLAEAVTNIVLSIIFVNKWGITGVLLATILALPLKVIYLNWLADKKIIKRSARRTVKILCVNYIIFGLTVCLKPYLTIQATSYFSLALVGALLVVIYSIVAFIVNLLANKDLSAAFYLFLHKEN